MTFYFSGDGTLKYTTRVVSVSNGKVYSSDSSSTDTTTTTSPSSFTAEMKLAAYNASMAAKGKLTTEEKDAARAKCVNSEFIDKMQAKIIKIQNSSPRTFDDDEDYTYDSSALDAYFSALETKNNYKSSSS